MTHTLTRARTACGNACGAAVMRPIGGTGALQQNGELAQLEYEQMVGTLAQTQPDDWAQLLLPLHQYTPHPQLAYERALRASARIRPWVKSYFKKGIRREYLFLWVLLDRRHISTHPKGKQEFGWRWLYFSTSLLRTQLASCRATWDPPISKGKKCVILHAAATWWSF